MVITLIKLIYFYSNAFSLYRDKPSPKRSVLSNTSSVLLKRTRVSAKCLSTPLAPLFSPKRRRRKSAAFCKWITYSDGVERLIFHEVACFLISHTYSHTHTHTLTYHILFAEPVSCSFSASLRLLSCSSGPPNY